jgi:hypothetical protein
MDATGVGLHGPLQRRLANNRMEWATTLAAVQPPAKNLAPKPGANLGAKTWRVSWRNSLANLYRAF